MNKLLLMTLAVSAGLTSAMALAQVAAPPAPQARPNMPMLRMDANGDGMISKEEAAKFPRLAGKFDQIDTSKDGKLSADELTAWRKSAAGGRMHGHGAGDKAPEEMQAHRAARQAECFDKADTDKNGQLSRDEFAKLHEACGPMGGGMRHGGAGHMPPPAPPAPPPPPAPPAPPARK